MTAHASEFEKAPSKLDWQHDQDTIIKKALEVKDHHFDHILLNMSLLYNVSNQELPFKTVILFTDQTLGVSRLDTKTLINNWTDQFGQLINYFNQAHGSIFNKNKHLPVTLGKYAYQYFNDDTDVHHVLALHNIHLHYPDAKCKKATWIEVDHHFKFKIALKNKYLKEKMELYTTFSQYNLRFFNQMAFYSQNFTTNPYTHSEENDLKNPANYQYTVAESDYQPIKDYQSFGQLDTANQLFANFLDYLFGAEKLKKIAGKHVQAKLRKIQKGYKPLE